MIVKAEGTKISETIRMIASERLDENTFAKMTLN
jgi:hypothetical protein